MPLLEIKPMCFSLALLTQSCPTLVLLMLSSIDHPVWLNDLGVLLQQQGELDRAIDLFQQTLQKFVGS